MADPRRLLSSASLYRVSQSLLGGRRARRLVVERHLTDLAGKRVLDLGCGPGDVLDHLPADVDYTGVDLSAGYIEHARKTHGDRGEFVCASVDSWEPEAGAFDVVLALGILHHLDDGAATGMMSRAARALGAQGRLFTLDGCFRPGQPPLARLLLRLDRGEHVRDRAAYEALARSSFGRVESRFEEGLFHLPYTILVMEASSA